MADVEFVMSRTFLRALLQSPEVEAAMRDAAQRVLSAAAGGAPVRTGDYLRSLRMVSGVEKGRAKARVGSTDPGAPKIEKRTGNLRRALGSA
jgi:hypothetical protein